MMQKERKERNQLEFVNIEALVPKEHLLRKIDAVVDFNKIYDFVEAQQRQTRHRSCCAVQNNFDTAISLWHTISQKDCYWFIGYQETPRFSTLSYNFKYRYIPETVFVDGTHIKANANIKKVVKKEIPKATKIYENQLMDEINKDREENGKKPFDGSKPPEKKIVNESTTDSESGVFRKGERKKCLA